MVTHKHVDGSSPLLLFFAHGVQTYQSQYHQEVLYFANTLAVQTYQYRYYQEVLYFCIYTRCSTLTSIRKPCILLIHKMFKLTSIRKPCILLIHKMFKLTSIRKPCILLIHKMFNPYQYQEILYFVNTQNVQTYQFHYYQEVLLCFHHCLL